MERKWLMGCGAALVISGMLGCATCCSPDLYNYPTYGGRYERVDRAYGRVGSIFSDPNALSGSPAPRESGEPVQVLPGNTGSQEPMELPPPKQGNSQPEVPESIKTPPSDGQPNGNQARTGRNRWR